MPKKSTFTGKNVLTSPDEDTIKPLASSASTIHEPQISQCSSENPVSLEKETGTITSNDSAFTQGLFLRGTILKRTRRYVGDDTSKPEIITYVVEHEDKHLFYVDDFAPPDYFEIGIPVELPVYVKAYKKRNGEPAYNLCIRREHINVVTHLRGETF